MRGERRALLKNKRVRRVRRVSRGDSDLNVLSALFRDAEKPRRAQTDYFVDNNAATRALWREAVFR